MDYNNLKKHYHYKQVENKKNRNHQIDNCGLKSGPTWNRTKHLLIMSQLL